MHSIILLDGTIAAIQGVLWTVLAVFFVMTILGWLVTSRDWFKEDEPAPVEDREEQGEGQTADQA